MTPAVSTVGDPPAKHQAIQAKSGSQAEQATRAHLAQPSQLKQSVVLEPSKDIRFGWIPNALRTSGKFYNELMPQFYQSFGSSILIIRLSEMPS